MTDARPSGGIAEAIFEGTAPPPLRAAAARGALPLPRPALVRLFLFLLDDEEEGIRLDAQASLDALTHEQMLVVASDPDSSAEVLDFIASKNPRDEALAERVVFHRTVPATALARFAAQGNSNIIELVLTNQERLLSHPELLDGLAINPSLRADQRARIIELLGRVARSSERAASAVTAGDTEGTELDELARLLDVDIGELIAASEIVDGDEFENAADPQLRSAYRRILTLNTAQRAILAMKGGREERMILIRDTNKIVSLSVLKNPRITDDDVESISRMRGVTDQILRQIGTNRDWLKSYAIISGLVYNPRTPQGISTNLISRMQNQDLKKVMGSHDVPELVRRMAKRTLETRTQLSRLKKKK